MSIEQVIAYVTKNPGPTFIWIILAAIALRIAIGVLAFSGLAVYAVLATRKSK